VRRAIRPSRMPHTRVDTWSLKSRSRGRLLWVYRYFADELVDPISITAGLVQTGLYLDFFYVYFTKYVSYLKYVALSAVLTFHIAFLHTLPFIGFSRAKSLSYRHDT